MVGRTGTILGRVWQGRNRRADEAQAYRAWDRRARTHHRPAAGAWEQRGRYAHAVAHDASDGSLSAVCHRHASAAGRAPSDGGRARAADADDSPAHRDAGPVRDARAVGQPLPPPNVRVSEIEMPPGVHPSCQRCGGCHTYGERDPAGWGSVLDLSRMIASDIVVPGRSRQLPA